MSAPTSPLRQLYDQPAFAIVGTETSLQNNEGEMNVDRNMK